jgi:hypothetical protein
MSSEHLDPSWGAEVEGYTPDARVVYKDKHGALFTIREWGENGDKVGRESYAGEVETRKPRQKKEED